MNDQLTSEQLSALNGSNSNSLTFDQTRALMGGANNMLKNQVRNMTNNVVQGSMAGKGASNADLLTGAVKRVGGTLQNIGNMVAKPLGEAMGASPQSIGLPSKDFQESDTAQSIGGVAVDIGELFTPMGEESAVAKGSSYIDKLPDAIGLTGKAAKAVTATLKTALQGVVGAAKFGGITGAQTGSLSQAKSAAELGGGAGATTEAVGAAINAAKSILPDVLSFTSGIPKGAIEKSIQNPETLKIGLNSSMQEIRTKAETALGAIDKDMKSTFEKGLSDLQKRTPSRFTPGKSNSFSIMMGQTLNDVKEGLPSIFRDYGVSVQGNGSTLDFEKLNSPIVKGAEQSNLQKALDTINRQKDFSPQGTQRVAARLNALTKYGDNNESSAIITRVKNAYDSAIKKNYPELAQLRKQYGEVSNKISDIKNVIGSINDSPKQVQSAVNRLTQIYNDDKETYLNTIKTLGQMTGTDFEGLIASDKFKQILPAYIRGIGGGGAVSLGSAAVAHFLNPLYLLALPLFSPAAIGKGIEYGDKLPSIGTNAVKLGTSGYQGYKDFQAADNSLSQ